MGTGSGIRKQLENERGWGRRGSPEDGSMGCRRHGGRTHTGTVWREGLLYILRCVSNLSIKSIKIYLLKNIKLIFQKYWTNIFSSPSRARPQRERMLGSIRLFWNFGEMNEWVDREPTRARIEKRMDSAQCWKAFGPRMHRTSNGCLFMEGSRFIIIS